VDLVYNSTWCVYYLECLSEIQSIVNQRTVLSVNGEEREQRKQTDGDKNSISTSNVNDSESQMTFPDCRVIHRSETSRAQNMITRSEKHLIISVTKKK